MAEFRRFLLYFAPVIALAFGYACHLGGLNAKASQTAGITLLCGLWWVFECLPIFATGLVPFVLLPLFNIVSHDQIAHAYGHTLIMLLMAGILLSRAMEKCGVHRRLALGLVRAVGGRGGRRLVLGFMLASGLLSMWISNTATTLMLLPIALAVLEQSSDKKLYPALLMGIAFASSIGGMATPVGTPANLIFMANMDTLQPNEPFSFARWMSIGIPIFVVFLPLIWLWVTRKLERDERLELPRVGEMSQAEILTLAVFFLTAFLWIFRQAPFGGWTHWMGLTPADTSPFVGDSTVALFAVVLLFVLPNGKSPGSVENFVDTRLMDWETAARAPWGILLLFGGGLAIATAFQESGLSEFIGGRLGFVTTLPSWALIATVCLTVSLLTELTSSTATTALLLPVLGSMAIKSDLPPEFLMAPATISASCAFMLPVATAPNTIIYSAGGIEVGKMARDGIVLNLLGVLIVSTVCYWLLA